MHRTPNRGAAVLALLLAVAGVAACGGDSPSTPPGPVVASVTIEPTAATVLVPRTQLLTATVRDGGGAPIAGKSVSWHSDNQAVATVTTSGTVTAVAPGTASITATVDGKVGTATITVALAPVANVVVTPATQTLGLGGSVQLNAVVRDAEGNTLTGRAVTWASDGEAIASVDSNGMVRGESAGTAVITATAEGVHGTAQIVVTPTAAVLVSSVSPAQLQDGQTATINGSGFNPDPAQNTVLIGGLTAQVVSATPTTLTVTVPVSACLPARNVAVRVTANGNSGELAHPWRPSTFFDVPVGQQIRLTGAAAACLQFDASAQAGTFLVGVQSVSEVASSLTPIRVRTTAASGLAASVESVLHEHAVQHGAEQLPTSRVADRLRRHREAELAFRIRERQILQRPMSRPSRDLSALSSAASAAVPATVAVGDSITVRYPDADNSCNSSTPVRTVVRHKGARSIWLEDVTNPGTGFSAADYTALATQFDGSIFEANRDYFGEPTDLDGNGRIVIVITQEINKEENTLGRVYFSDLFPDQCTAANGGEFFYGIAPDSTGAVGPELTVSDARAYYPVIIAHELAHVIQVGRRSRAPGFTAFQTLWELEGQATLAEEIVGHKVTGNKPGQNYGFAVAWNEPTMHPVDWYIGPVIDLVYYFGFQSQTSTIAGAPEQCGWLDRSVDGSMGPCLGGRSLYGVTWSFLRWISDQFGPSFPGGEQGLHRAMVTDSRTGFATIEAVTGRPMAELLAQWSAMLYLDGRYTGLDPKLTLSSWDFHGGAGHGIWTRLVENAQLRPRLVPFGTFNHTASVRAGSTAYYLLGGNARSATAVSVELQAGGVMPQHMQLWVVRVQ